MQKYKKKMFFYLFACFFIFVRAKGAKKVGALAPDFCNDCQTTVWAVLT